VEDRFPSVATIHHLVNRPSKFNAEFRRHLCLTPCRLALGCNA
jgi:hypothetical protein